MKNNKKNQKVAPKSKAKSAPTKAATKSVKPLKKVAKTPVKAVKKATPAKAVKAPAKKQSAAVKVTAKKQSQIKTVAKQVKASPKAVVKAPVKPVAKTAPQKPVSMKEMVKAQAGKAAVKTEAKVTPTAAKAPANKAVAKTAIVVKAAQNQNQGKALPESKTAPAAKVMAAATPVKTAPVSPSAAAASLAARPAYRPIQVIHKPLPSAQPSRPMAQVAAPANEKTEYKKGDYVVYPAHGVGQIEAIETQIIGGMDIKLYAIVFEKDRMRLKVPVFKAHASGLRRLSSPTQMQDALKTLQGRAHIRRVMWSRRAQEYETKINSGDPVAIAEVLRDLKRSNDESEQSYSERQIYQSALERLAREVAALDRISEIEAAEKLETLIRGKRAKANADDKKSDVAVEDEQAEAA